MVLTRLKDIYADTHARQALSLGYPVSQAFDYAALAPFLSVHLNNLGDPYAAESTLLNTRALEQEVLAYFGKLWRSTDRKPLVPESFWGYLLGMGATEGNMYALWSAREYLRTQDFTEGAKSSVREEPVVFYSEASHYSMAKCASALGIPTFEDLGNGLYPGQCPVTSDGRWPHGVPTDNGAVDPERLAELVDFFADKGHPPIIVLNAGTTFAGSFDDSPAVWQALCPVLERHSFRTGTDGANRQDFWIHVDGALGAAYLPYLEMAHTQKLTSERGPRFDFSLPYICSIVTSSHKWYGAPFASGVYMSREKYRMRPETHPEYVSTPDTTLCGSRNGLSALILWYALATISPDEQAATAARCTELAAYAHHQLQSISEWHPSFQVHRAPPSLAVRFTRPRPDIFDRFHLSGEGKLAHIVVMPHVTRSAIDLLVDALRSTDALA
ncbi:histidine decarboxylase [Paraburkholderia kururiensis]